jgi:hypothetical protein
MADEQRTHEILFIIGTGRCGSTIVQEMVARHPDVAFVSNVDNLLMRLDLKGWWNSFLYRRIPPRFTQRDRVVPHLIQTQLHFGPSEAYQLIERDVSPSVSTPFRDLTEKDVTPWLERRFRGFVEDRVAAQKKRLFMHKFTGWPRARFLREIFPEARFLHVIRDGRAVASSLMQRGWWRGHLGPWAWGLGPLPERYAADWEACERSLVALAGIEWKVLMDAFEDAKAHIPPERWMEVRYEDFVENPRQHMGRLLEWIGLPWSSDFESSFAKYSYGQHRKAAYTKDLRPEQAGLLDDLLVDHLRRLGYMGPTPA